jgi:trehalose/maltose transport system permease protein
VAKRNGQARGGDLPLWISVGVIVASVVLPILLVLRVSVSSAADLHSDQPSLVPHSLSLTHYATVFGDPQFITSLENSLIITGATTVLALVLGGPAAYALARLRFRLRTVIMTGILAISFFPAVAIIAPLFVEFRNLGLLDTYVAVVLADTVFVLPLTVWVLAAYLRQLPPELEDAAKVDGATTFQAFRRVIVPVAAPGVFTAAILTFIATWNEFLFAITFLLDQSKWPVTVLIPNYTQSRLIPDYGAQAAAALVVTLPILVLVLVFQRRIVSGLTAGALSG